MSLNIYNFDHFDGYAKCENQGDYELRIYLIGHCNCEIAICSMVENGEERLYNLYNFICDKDHLKNLRANKVNWFKPITELELYVDEVSTFLCKFIQFAIENKVDVKLNALPWNGR